MPQPAQSAVDVLKAYYIKLGIMPDKKDLTETEKAFGPLLKKLNEFATQDLKGTVWTKSGTLSRKLFGDIKDQSSNMKSLLSHVYQLQNILEADPDSEFVKGTLDNFSGLTKLTVGLTKGLGGMLQFLGLATDSVEAFGMAADIASVGITLLVKAAMTVVQWMGDLADSVMGAREEMVQYDRILGGVGAKTLVDFDTTIRKNTANLLAEGVALSTVREAATSYLRNGLTPLLATNSKLLETTIKLSDVTGESRETLASFFSTLIKGSNVSVQNITSLVDSFITVNRQTTRFSELGPISFADFREAINASSNALAVAAKKGKQFTTDLFNDLSTVTMLANRLGLSAGQLAGQFEDASNIITNMTSGFRTFLFLSGGANISNVLTNTFDRTESLIKMANKVQELNAKFSDNINITAQVMETSFGINKETTIKLSNMTAAQITQIRALRADLDKLKNPVIDSAWQNFTNRLSATWDRFKQSISNIFQSSFASNSGLQRLIDRISTSLQNIINFGSKSGLWQKIESFFTRIANFIAKAGNKVWDWIEGGLQKIQDLFASWGKGESPIADAMDHMLESAASKAGSAFAKSALKWLWDHTTIGMIVNAFSGDEEAENKRRKSQDAYLGKVKEAFTGITTSIDKRISTVKSELGLYDGAKTTDIIYARNKDTGKAEFMAAGMYKLQLEEEKQRLEKERDEVAKNIDKNLSLIQSQLATGQLNVALTDDQIQALQKTGAISVDPRTKQITWNTPKPQSPSPIARQALRLSQAATTGNFSLFFIE